MLFFLLRFSSLQNFTVCVKNMGENNHVLNIFFLLKPLQKFLLDTTYVFMAIWEIVFPLNYTKLQKTILEHSAISTFSFTLQPILGGLLHRLSDMSRKSCFRLQRQSQTSYRKSNRICSKQHHLFYILIALFTKWRLNNEFSVTLAFLVGGV